MSYMLTVFIRARLSSKGSKQTLGLLKKRTKVRDDVRSQFVVHLR